MKEKNEKNTTGMEPIPPALVTEAKAGDEAAFTELYERTSSLVYRTIRSMIGDEELVWDVQQDAYLRAWRSLDSLEAPEAFLPWLRRIAVNTAVNALNKRVPLTFTDLAGEEDGQEPELPDPDPAGQPELALDRKETSRLVRELLKELPPEQQAVVGMYYYEDMPVKDIAELLHVSPSTVKTQLSRGRKRIEAGVRALEKRGVKLYGLSPLPFLLALLRRLEPGQAAEQKALAAVLAEAPAAGGTAAVTVTAMTAGQAFLHGLGAKLAVGVLALAVVVGGLWAGDRFLRRSQTEIGDFQPTAVETLSSEDPQKEQPSLIPPVQTEPSPELHAPFTEPAETQTEPVAPSEGEPPGESAAPEDPPEETIYTGSCGTYLTWTLDAATGSLTVSGKDRMVDYWYRDPPWTECPVSIQTFRMEEGAQTVGAEALYRCRELNSVELPESLIAIEEAAFTECVSLRSIRFSKNMTVIWDEAFKGCTGLREIDLSGKLETIKGYAFWGCTGLRSVKLPERMKSIESGAFAFCWNLGSIQIPDGVSVIKNSCFFYCKSLSSVRIPASVTSIKDCAFYGCTALSALELPESVISIGEMAFTDCAALTSIRIPSSVTTIGLNAFIGCDRLTIIGAEGSVAQQYAQEYGIPFQPEGDPGTGMPSSAEPANNGSGEEEAEAGQSAPGTVQTEREYSGVCGENLRWTLVSETGLLTISGSGEMLSYQADIQNTAVDTQAPWRRLPVSVKALRLEEGVVSIGNCAFFGCQDLRSVSLPTSLRTIGDQAFSGCVSLRAVTIPQRVTTLGNSSFFGCSGLRSVDFPEGMTSIGIRAFCMCNNLRCLQFPASLKTINREAFCGCYYLSCIRFSEGLTSIGASAFSSCNHLVSLELPEGLKSVANSAFPRNLNVVVIPDSLQVLDKNVFSSYLCVVIGSEGGAAYRFAEENQIVFFPRETFPEG